MEMFNGYEVCDARSVSSRDLYDITPIVNDTVLCT